MNPAFILLILVMAGIAWLTLSDNYQSIGDNIIHFLEDLKNNDEDLSFEDNQENERK